MYGIEDPAACVLPMMMAKMCPLFVYPSCVFKVGTARRRLFPVAPRSTAARLL
jgi:hypothetical protein